MYFTNLFTCVTQMKEFPENKKKGIQGIYCLVVYALKTNKVLVPLHLYIFQAS